MIERKTESGIELATGSYTLSYRRDDPLYMKLRFKNGIDARLLIPSGCDRDEAIDTFLAISPPSLVKEGGKARLVFCAKTTLWERIEYVVECDETYLTYHYVTYGNGAIDNARFFQGFPEENPRLAGAGEPLYCGPSRANSYKRPVDFFLFSSDANIDAIYSNQINSADIRHIRPFERSTLRVNGDRHENGGDWLATPPPFLYLAGKQGTTSWLTFALLAKPGELNFTEYQYNGTGAGFGLNLIYDGYTQVDGRWESPRILLQACEDEYQGLEAYTKHLRKEKLVTPPATPHPPKWWRKPIFGGWGEQMFHSNHWEHYKHSGSMGWSGDGSSLCTQRAYEEMMRQLEDKGIDPTILIVDNRWFQKQNMLDVDEALWPDMRGFIDKQHEKGRKVILWVSPWSHKADLSGQDVPVCENMVKPTGEQFYKLEIDTDVFYPAVKRAKRKVRVPYAYKTNEQWERSVLAVDPLNPAYRDRVREKVRHLLSSDGLDADGFEFDYTHFLPRDRGFVPATPRPNHTWGVELLRELMVVYYRAAKEAKADALIINHIFNPYFADVTDMSRLQDIYTDRASIVAQMAHRAKVAQLACPECRIHTDQHPMPSLAAWREYAKFQVQIGNPCTYYVTGIETTKERFTDEDYSMLRDLWQEYNRKIEDGS
jgi:hypothetical protein